MLLRRGISINCESVLTKSIQKLRLPFPSSPTPLSVADFRIAQDVVVVVVVVLRPHPLQLHNLAMHVVQLRVGERLVDVSQLVGVDVQVVVGDDSGHELAVEIVVRDVDGADAPVRVRVAVRTRAERPV